MAESAALTAVINQAAEIGANLIVETGSRLYGLKEDIEWIQRQMRHFKSCLKDAESKQGGSHEVANLIIDMRDLALDIEDILDTYIPEIESHKGKGPFRFVKHVACILCYGATANTFALEIEKIKRRAREIEATRVICRINLDMGGGNADSEGWNRRKEFLVATESMVVGREDKFQELKEKLRSSNPECKMICVVGEAGVGYFALMLDTIELPPNLIYLILGGITFTEDSMRVLKKLPRLEIICLSYRRCNQSIKLDLSGANSFPELHVFFLAIKETEKDNMPELIVDETGMPKLYKFVCNQKDLNVPERLREIMVEAQDQLSIEELFLGRRLLR